jgi:hypothetical protein
MQERKLYLLGSGAICVALVLGVLAGAVSSGGTTSNREDKWQPSAIPAGVDTLADFTAITAQPRWYLEGGAVPSQAKTVEGEPESFRLLGIVSKAGQRYALLQPPAPESGRSKLVQLGVGDVLIGDWKITEISSAKVAVSASESGEARELLLYGSPTPASPSNTAVTGQHKAGAKRAQAAVGSVKAKSADAGNSHDKAKPKKDKAERDKARAERLEQREKAKAAAARQKAEKDTASKHKTQ